MVRTSINDLNSRYESEFLDDLSFQDMKTIQGGYDSIRWRRTPATTQGENAITGIPSIDARINSWQTELAEHYKTLEGDFGF